MRSDKDKIDLINPTIITLFIILMFIIPLMIRSQAASLTKENTYQSYILESKDYIQKNKEGLKVIFNELFPTTESFVKVDEQAIPKLITQDLKHWSSTIFIKQVGENILMMRLSGDTKEFFVTTQLKKNSIANLLSGNPDFLPIEDYTTELSGNEFIMSIKDNSNNVLGAIVRGVIY